MDRCAELQLAQAGAFDFSYTVTALDGTVATYTGAFVVEPTLTLDGQPVPLDGLAVQTVITRCLGPLDQWYDRLRVTAESGFNMIHFTPIQVCALANHHHHHQKKKKKKKEEEEE
jgi:glycogen debranching enzyme